MRTESIYSKIAQRWLTNGNPLANTRMHFEGDTLYSYGRHYPIARIDRENNIILFNHTRSSLTTNRHKGIVIAECRKTNNTVLLVPDPSNSLTNNLTLLREQLQRAIDTATKRMIKPNMQTVEGVANNFDVLVAYMGETNNIMNTKIYTDYLNLKAAYAAKRGIK